MSAFRYARHPEAFSLDPTDRKKRPRNKDAGYLNWLHSLPCLVTGTKPVEAAHIRYGDARYGKRPTGMQEKADDRWAVPLSPAEHRRQHSMNERDYWQSVGIDPLQVALALYGCDRDNTMAEIILRNTRRSA